MSDYVVDEVERRPATRRQPADRRATACRRRPARRRRARHDRPAAGRRAAIGTGDRPGCRSTSRFAVAQVDEDRRSRWRNVSARPLRSMSSTVGSSGSSRRDRDGQIERRLRRASWRACWCRHESTKTYAPTPSTTAVTPRGRRARRPVEPGPPRPRITSAASAGGLVARAADGKDELGRPRDRPRSWRATAGSRRRRGASRRGSRSPRSDRAACHG